MARVDGRKIVMALLTSKIKVIASVPDTTTKEGILLPLTKMPNMRVVDVCKEDEGISICSALSYCNIRAVMLMQQTGFFDSINNIVRNAIIFERPVIMMIGMLGWKEQVKNEDNSKYYVRVVEPLIKALNIDYISVDSDTDVPLIKQGINNAYEKSKPFIILLNKGAAADYTKKDFNLK